MPVISLLVTILVLCLVFGIIWYIITIIPILQPFKNIALIILGVIAIILLLGMVFGGLPMPRIGIA